MSGIKLPVTVEEDADLFRENVRSMWILREDDGREIIRSSQQNALQRIAAALNAAPKRAFAELTEKTYAALVNKATREVRADHDYLAGDADLSVEIAAAVVSLLQAFAAPVAPAWLGITEQAVRGKGFLLLHPIERLKAQAPIVAEFERALSGEAQWIEEGGTTYSFDCFTHWQPLPAAPETQGGREDE
jgi:hypothetical protein